jgi:hypothetical protein
MNVKEACLEGVGGREERERKGYGEVKRMELCHMYMRYINIIYYNEARQSLLERGGGGMGL